MTERLRQPDALLAMAILAAAPVLGLLAGVDPRFALAAAFGAAFIAFVLHDLTVGFCLMAFLASLDGVPALSGGAISAPKLAGVLLAISWLATIATRREGTILDRRPLLVGLLVAFIGWQALSIAWAEEQGSVLTVLSRYVPNLLLIAIAFSALRTDRHLRLAVLALLAGVLISAVLSVGSTPTDDRAAGLAGGANELGAAMVVGIVLCLVLALMRVHAGLLSAALMVGVMVCTLALFLSLSRGGLVALGTALAFAVLVAGRWRKQMVGAAFFVLLAGAAYFTTVASLPARERVFELGGGTGRTDLWTVGWRMFESNPLVGVGAGNFPTASIHYLLRPGAIEADEFIITVPKVAHNSFIEVAAETGLPGLIGFVAIVLLCLLGMYRGARAFEAAGRRDMELLCRGLAVATVGYLVAALFITANYQKLLWLLLALGPVCQALGMRARDGAVDASARPAASRPAQAASLGTARPPRPRMT